MRTLKLNNSLKVQAYQGLSSDNFVISVSLMALKLSQDKGLRSLDPRCNSFSKKVGPIFKMAYLVKFLMKFHKKKCSRFRNTYSFTLAMTPHAAGCFRLSAHVSKNNSFLGRL